MTMLILKSALKKPAKQLF